LRFVPEGYQLVDCSFCGRPNREVHIVAGRDNLCSQCVEKCADILDRDTDIASPRRRLGWSLASEGSTARAPLSIRWSVNPAKSIHSPGPASSHLSLPRGWQAIGKCIVDEASTSPTRTSRDGRIVARPRVQHVCSSCCSAAEARPVINLTSRLSPVVRLWSATPACLLPASLN
jgi:hypothetical protein